MIAMNEFGVKEKGSFWANSLARISIGCSTENLMKRANEENRINMQVHLFFQ